MSGSDSKRGWQAGAREHLDEPMESGSEATIRERSEDMPEDLEEMVVDDELIVSFDDETDTPPPPPYSQPKEGLIAFEDEDQPRAEREVPVEQQVRGELVDEFIMDFDDEPEFEAGESIVFDDESDLQVGELLSEVHLGEEDLPELEPLEYVLAEDHPLAGAEDLFVEPASLLDSPDATSVPVEAYQLVEPVYELADETEPRDRSSEPFEVYELADATEPMLFDDESSAQQEVGVEPQIYEGVLEPLSEGELQASEPLEVFELADVGEPLEVFNVVEPLPESSYEVAHSVVAEGLIGEDLLEQLDPAGPAGPLAEDEFEQVEVDTAPAEVERARGLIETYRREASVASPERAARFMSDVSSLYQEKLGDLRSAWSALEEALSLCPTSSSVRRQARKLLPSVKDVERTVSLLEILAKDALNVTEKVNLLIELATIQQLRPGKESVAQSVYERILELDPTNLSATKALLQLSIRGHKWERVSELCSTLAEGESDVRSRFSLLVEAALLMDMKVDERARLAMLALEADQHSDLAQALALSVYRKKENWERSVELLEDRAKQSPYKAASLHFQASRILAEKLGQTRNAINTAEKAVSKSPKEPVYLDWLAELYRREARWGDLMSVLRRKLEIVQRNDEKVETLVTIADIYDSRTNEPQLAIRELEKALDLAPTELPVLQSLGSLYSQMGRWPDLAKMHIKEAAASTNAARKASALFRCAMIHEDRLGQRDEAIRHLESALVEDVSFGPALRTLEVLYRQEERWEDLLRLLRAALEHTVQQKVRAVILEQLAEIYDRHTKDRQKAREAYKDLLALDPLNRPALAAIARLYEEERDFPAVITVLRDLVNRTLDPKEKVDVLLRMAQITERELNDTGKAVSYYEEALKLRPDLSEIYQQLGRLLHAIKDWKQLVKLYRRELKVLGDSQEQVRLHYRIGRIQEQHLEQLKEANEAYRSAFEQDPSFWPAFRGILRVARRLDAYQIVVEMENKLLENMPPELDKSPALIRLGLLLEEEAGEPDSAQALFAKAYQNDPSNSLARMLLLRSMVSGNQWEKLLEQLSPFDASLVAGGGMKRPDMALALLKNGSDRHPDQIATLRRKEILAASQGDRQRQAEALVSLAELEPTPEAQADARHRLAVLAEYAELEGIDPLALYQDVMKAQPENLLLLDAIERTARRREDSALLLDILARQAEVALTAEATSAAMVDRANLLLSLKREEEAIAQFRAALELDSECRAAYDNLRWLYWEREDLDELEWVLEQGLNSVLHPDTLATDLVLRADFRIDRGDWPAALEDLDRVLELRPADPQALERIDRGLSERGEWDELLRRLEDAARKTPQTELKGTIFLQIGLIHQNEFNDLNQAEKFFTLAINASPNNAKALLATAQLRVRLDQPTEAMVLLSRVVLKSAEQEDMFAASLEIARICRDILGDPVRARSSLEVILLREPDHLEALRQMAEIAGQTKDWDRLESTLRRLILLEEEPSELARYQIWLSEFISRKYGDEEPEVIELLEAAAQLEPDNIDILKRLIAFYQGHSRWEELESLLAKAIEHLPDEHKPDFLLSRASILAKRLNRGEQAQDVLREVLRVDPKNEKVARLLLEQFEPSQLEDPELVFEAVKLHQDMLDRQPVNVKLIRTMRQLQAKLGANDETYRADSCLVLLGEATEEEVYFHKQRRRRLPPKASGTLSPELVSKTLLPRGDHPVRTILSILRPHLTDLFPIDLGHYGLVSLEGADLDETHPARAVVSYCGEILGVKEYNLVEALGGIPSGTVEPGPVSTLLLPSDFLRLSVPDQRFICGRLLSRLCLSTEAFDGSRSEPMSPRDLELLLAALRRTGEPDFGAEVAPTVILDDLVNRLVKRLTKEQLAKARQLILEMEDDKSRLALWIHSTEVGACLGGLICSGDIISSWNLMARTVGGSPPEDLLADLCRFFNSAQYSEIRQQLSIAIPRDQ